MVAPGTAAKNLINLKFVRRAEVDHGGIIRAIGDHADTEVAVQRHLGCEGVSGTNTQVKGRAGRARRIAHVGSAKEVTRDSCR